MALPQTLRSLARPAAPWAEYRSLGPLTLRYSDKMRTAPFSAFTACARASGHWAAPALAAVRVTGVGGQKASWPVLFTVRTDTRSPATRGCGSAVSGPRSNHWFATAGRCRIVRVALSEAVFATPSRRQASPA